MSRNVRRWIRARLSRGGPALRRHTGTPSGKEPSGLDGLGTNVAGREPPGEVYARRAVF